VCQTADKLGSDLGSFDILVEQYKIGIFTDLQVGSNNGSAREDVKHELTHTHYQT